MHTHTYTHMHTHLSQSVFTPAGVGFPGGISGKKNPPANAGDKDTGSIPG